VKRIALFAVMVLLLVAVMFWRSPESTSNGKPATSSVGSAVRPGPASTSREESVATPATSGSRAKRAHLTPPAELPSGPVRDYLPGLLQRASGPNPSAEAAMAAFLALNACRFLQAHPAPPSDLRPNLQDCAGITEKEWADAPRLLKLAADLGNERAQLAYARKQPLDEKKLEDFLQNPEELVEFRNNANRYLLAASEAGNLDAMWFLSESLRTGDLMAQNLAAAYQYKYAISRAGGYPHTINAELANLESQLTPAQVATARENADRFLARCCR
jgi:hypothetical protein